MNKTPLQEVAEVTQDMLTRNIATQHAEFVEKQTKFIESRGLETEMFSRFLEISKTMFDVKASDFYSMLTLHAAYKHIPSARMLPDILLKADRATDPKVLTASGDFQLTADMVEDIRPGTVLDLQDYLSVTATVTVGIKRYSEGDLQMLMIDESFQPRLRVEVVHQDPNTGETDHSVLEEGYRIYDFIAEILKDTMLDSQQLVIKTRGRVPMFTTALAEAENVFIAMGATIEDRVDSMVPPADAETTPVESTTKAERHAAITSIIDSQLIEDNDIGSLSDVIGEVDPAK